MSRARIVLLFFPALAVAAAVTFPASAGQSRVKVGCSDSIVSGQQTACRTAFKISHFNRDDAIDYNSLVARIVSPHASGWTVQANIRDASGVMYFAWYCSVSESSVSSGGEAYVDRTCMSARRTVSVQEDGQTYQDYYVADTSGPQVMTVIADVTTCADTPTGTCSFEGAADYLLRGRTGRPGFLTDDADTSAPLVPDTPF